MPKKSPKNQAVLRALKKEMDKNLYLADSEKRYWLTNAAKLPPKMIGYFLYLLKNENRIAEKAIKKAINNKPGLVSEITNKSKTIRAELRKLRNLEEASEADQSLEEYLKQT